MAIILLLLTTWAIMLPLAWWLGNRSRRGNMPNAADRAQLESQAVSPAALWKAFDQNQVAAQDTYRTGIVIKGQASSIEADYNGCPVVYFNADHDGFHKICCTFSQTARKEVAKLKKGQWIFITGNCPSKAIYVNVEALSVQAVDDALELAEQTPKANQKPPRRLKCQKMLDAQRVE
jgi:hypothetical protein